MITDTTTPPIPAATAQNAPEDFVDGNPQQPQSTASLVGESKQAGRKRHSKGINLMPSKKQQTEEAKRLSSWRRFLRDRLDLQTAHVGGETVTIEWGKYRALFWGIKTWKTDPVLLKEFVDLMDLHNAQYTAFDNDACTRGSLQKVE